MSILNSILFGSDGFYNILEIPVNFSRDEPDGNDDLWNTDKLALVQKIGVNLLRSNTFRYTTQSYAHVFVHEMSHALAWKLLITKNNPEVFIFTNTCLGFNDTNISEFYRSPKWKTTIFLAAGSIGNIAFSGCKLVAATALKNYLTWPVSLVLGSSGVIWLAGELLSQFESAKNRDIGDFGCIATQNGNAHLALASAALISECALSIFAAIKFAA